MICGIGILYRNVPVDQVFLHILLLLTIIGAYMNTDMFNSSRDKYYAMILLRMNAREYTLVNYGYNILKVIIGFLPFSIIFGMLRDVPLWFCILIPFSVAESSSQLRHILYGIMRGAGLFTMRISLKSISGSLRQFFWHSLISCPLQEWCSHPRYPWL